MKRFYYLAGGCIALFMSLSIFAFVKAKSGSTDKHLEVVLRNIGHQLLLHSKDSTSRVLPVTAINENLYQISFESSFEFVPDTLMSLIRRQLAKTDVSQDYIVNVKECNENKTIFAFEINQFTGDIKPCGERKQERACYLVQIEFLKEEPFNKNWLFLPLIPLAFAGFYLKRRQNKQAQERSGLQENAPGPLLTSMESLTPALAYKQLGEFKFFDQKTILVLRGETIELSEKEKKALNIFFSTQDAVVERTRLMKELWEDEGVFVIDRNVDVLVSKLRKKLSADASVKIVNVHGKGYKLVVG